MKLKEQHEKFQDLWNKGFRFNPEEGLFYTSQSNFEKPLGFEEWGVEKVDQNEYLNSRLKELGITEKANEIELIDDKGKRNAQRGMFPVFTGNKHGDIEILQYSLYRKPWTYLPSGKENESHANYHAQIRLNPRNEAIAIGKYDFSEAKNCPFWHPNLIAAYEGCLHYKLTIEDKKTKKSKKNPNPKSTVKTLTITEGQFKAFKASQDGIPTVGLTSISHFRDKRTQKIHAEIFDFIKVCEVQKVVILWDADCRDISMKAIDKKQDLGTRPNNFFKFARTIRDGLQEYFPKTRLSIFFATIQKMDFNGFPKGIDDLLIHLKSSSALQAELENVGNLPGQLIYDVNITTDQGIKKLKEWFCLSWYTDFYKFHQDKIKNNTFTFLGTTYRVEVSKDLKVYKRIGTDYYKLKMTPNPSGRKGETFLEEELVPWKESAIKLDHGNGAKNDNVLNHIEKLEGFSNIASHTDFQQIINSHWNLYYNVKHEKQEGDFPTIKILLEHLFEEHWENEMIQDYLTILYRDPMQKLPVICLVSEEQGTGKSTFLFLLKLLFKQNMAIISNNDLTSDFNSQWTSRLVVASEETLLDKKDGYEKIKAISTQKTIMRNEKFGNAREIPCMVHFVFCSNHEDSFIKINESDSRLWIRKVKSLKEQINDFDDLLEKETPQLVHFLENREMKHERKGRLFFAPKDFQTDAFRAVVQNSEPGIIKEIREAIRESFHKLGGNERLLTAQDLKKHFGINCEINYLNSAIKRYLKLNRFMDETGTEKVTKYSFDSIDHNGDKKTIRSTGRPFIFPIEKFCDILEIDQINEATEKRMKEAIQKVSKEELPFKI